jgi:hypothetical protein
MENKFTVETFDKKDDRDQRYRELKIAKRRRLVKFSSNRIIEGAAKILANYNGRLELDKLPGHTTRILHGRVRPVCVSTWSVAYPIW